MSNRKFAKAVLECGQTVEERIDHILPILQELGEKVAILREDNGYMHDEGTVLECMIKEFVKLAPDLAKNYHVKLMTLARNHISLRYHVTLRIEKNAFAERYMYNIGYDVASDDYIPFEGPLVRFDLDGDTGRQSYANDFLGQFQTPDDIRERLGLYARERYGIGVLQADSVVAVPRTSSTDSGSIRGIGASYMIVDEAQYLSEDDLETLRSRTAQATGIPGMYAGTQNAGASEELIRLASERVSRQVEQAILNINVRGDIGV